MNNIPPRDLMTNPEDEDHWEIGEGADAPERHAFSQPTPSPLNRTPLLVAGVVLALAVAGWFGRSLLQQPSTPLSEVVSPPQPLPQSQPSSALTFSQVEPRAGTLKMTEGELVAFAVQASGAEPFSYEWTVNGKKTGAQPTFTWKARGEGKYRVKAVVKDQAGLSASQEWQVAVVAAPPPLTSPPTAPSAPKNTAPRIAQRLPIERTVSAREGETVQFSALALDPDGEEVAYMWSVDGKRAAQGDRFTYAASAVGKHLIDLEVTDKGGLKDIFRWDVQVEAPPAAPRVTMYTPHKQRLQLYAHLSRFFGVEVETPGMPEPLIQYAWKIDSRPTAGRELLEFKNQPPGRHEVEVTATGPSGASVSHRWVVDVQERQGLDEQGFGGPPRLEMFALDNEVSPDKKQVIVTGRLRNVSDREAENVIVWISALDARHGTVSRRLTLPSPQPFAPGQVTTFAASFANRSEISDFHIEVVSK